MVSRICQQINPLQTFNHLPGFVHRHSLVSRTTILLLINQLSLLLLLLSNISQFRHMSFRRWVVVCPTVDSFRRFSRTVVVYPIIISSCRRFRRTLVVCPIVSSCRLSRRIMLVVRPITSSFLHFRKTLQVIPLFHLTVLLGASSDVRPA